MAKKDRNNLHDRFLKEWFEDKEEVKAYLRDGLPKAIAENLDFDSLTADNNSYVDSNLRQYFADVVYNCTYGEDVPVKVTLLFEHKSILPANPFLQLIKYMVNIWDTQAKNKEPLQPIIPIIIYHGEESWQQRDFQS